MVAADRTPPASPAADDLLVAPLVIDLKEAGSAQLRFVGGKALNLGKLLAAGFPVPSGFCLTTEAYERALPAEIADLASQLEAAQRARELIGSSPVPPTVETALRAAYAELGDLPGEEPAVAVRSSATAEDLPFASFAGQQDTYLGVAGADAVIDAVRRCWASVWSERAVAYRSANRVSHRNVGLAVVVQRQVDAATAGVLFTANPVTGTRTETVIDASPGAGQAVVSGTVNPDHFVLDTATAWVLHRTPGGPEHARPPSLSDAQLSELTSLGDRVQRLFGTPQDAEWVIDAAGRIWLTQSRPITTLYPLEDPSTSGREGPSSESDAGTRVYLCGTLLQGLTRPLTPMGLSVLGRVGNRNGPWKYLNPGLRMFVDLTPAMRSKLGRRYLLQVLPLADGRSASVFPALLEDPRFRVVKPTRKFAAKAERSGRPARTRSAERTRGAEVTRSTERTRGAEATAALGLFLKLVPALVRAAVRPEAELRRAKAYGKRLEAELALPEPATAFQRLDYAQHILDRMVNGLIQATLPGPATGYIMLALARRLLRGIAQPRELEAVLRGLPHNVTTEMDLELWDVARAVSADPASREAFLQRRPNELTVSFRAGALPPAAQAGVRRFLARYGHRAVAEIDLGMPRWAEEPDHILGMISNYLRVEDPEQAPDRQFARAAEHAEARIGTLVERAASRSRWRALLLRLALRRVRELSGLRELPKFNIVMVLAEMHRQLSRIGTELARNGSIAAPDDVFFLDFDEVRVGLRGAELWGIVAGRHRLYDRELRRRHIPRILLSDGTDVEAAMMAKSPPADGLSGTPASGGTATGKVRVVLDPVGAHLEPGEILVTPSTDPGWTPLFLTAGALVMEMGGVISHGSVVAREYGIPAVVGVPDATTLLHTGQMVTVDGSAGTVRQ
ncbi:phosphohistidine swiveling domain-containing protein [Arthrobacter sp. V4I6]|uniref:PEP/pyruvate-binding domain-containing protein n=1 Tax=unclassified Arthrobacter TaxID=235627 RepID=UPI002780F9AE|nr:MULTISPECIES: PEP/pyruvate-binding domain-containing protein [unclassified Arthrobacter]MDQ0822956.1 phosphohistidine swiveling domain-containing protein [Arthrobacter sp. V1I7]MDQ0852585.1 phosphohistidine swiveling domain-containing protein [Arthrobacter sp. V4I6]